MRNSTSIRPSAVEPSSSAEPHPTSGDFAPCVAPWLVLALSLLPTAGLVPGVSRAAGAQEGREAAFAVRVTDEDGAPIPGAQVLAQPSEPGAAGGPPAVTTDELGQAVVSGLSEGEWFVEVSHPAYMLFAAYVDLRAGKKPQVGFSSQVNTETSWKPMTVKFVKASAEARRGATIRRPIERAPPEVVRERPEVEVEEPEPPRVVRPERAEEPAPTEEPAPIEEPTDKPAGEESAPTEPVSEATAEVPSAAESRRPEEAAVEAAPEPTESSTSRQATSPPVTPEAAAEEAEAAEAPAAEVPPLETESADAEPEQPPQQPTSEATERQDAVPEPKPAERPETPPAAPTAGDPLPGEPVSSQELEAGTKEVEAAPPVETSPTPPTLEAEAEEPEAGELESPDPTAEPEAPSDELTAPPPSETMDEGPAETEPVVPSEAPEGESPPVTETRATPPPPEATVEPSGGTPTRLPRFLRSAAAGNCPECEAGEWAVAAEQEAARAGESRAEQQCSEEFVQGAARAADLLADGPAARLEGYVGPLLTAMWRFDPEDRSALEELLGPRTDPASHCQMAGVVLPAGAEFTGYVIEAWDVLGGRSCLAGFDCAVGQSRWLGEPEIIEGEERIVVYGIFKNRSTRRERRARLTIYFRPPSADWTPASR